MRSSRGLLPWLLAALVKTNRFSAVCFSSGGQSCSGGLYELFTQLACDQIPAAENTKSEEQDVVCCCVCAFQRFLLQLVFCTENKAMCTPGGQLPSSCLQCPSRSPPQNICDSETVTLDCSQALREATTCKLKTGYLEKLLQTKA